jgi:ABC-2 type transport system permease protein
MLTLVRRTVDRIAVLLVVLAALLVLFQVALVAIAASLADGPGFEGLASLAPAFIQQILGPALASFGGLAAVGFFEPLIIMMVVQMAIYVATEPAGDVEAGLVDLVLARPVSRHVLVTRSLLVMTGVAIVLPVTMAASLWASLWWLAPPNVRWPEPRVVLLLTGHLAAVAWCFGAAALAAAAWAWRRGAAQSIVGVSAIAFYLLDTVAEAWDAVAWTAPLSPFHYFHGAEILAGRTDPARDLAMLIAVGVAGTALAYWQFRRRDV